MVTEAAILLADNEGKLTGLSLLTDVMDSVDGAADTALAMAAAAEVGVMVKL